jgi:hypothetical protein
MKKIIIIGGFIILVGALGFLMYYFFIKGPASPITPTVEDPASAKLPAIEEGGDPNVTQPDNQLPYSESIDPVVNVDQKMNESESVSDVANGGVARTYQMSVLEAEDVSLGGDGSLRYYSPENKKFYRVSSDGVADQLSGELFYGIKDVIWAKDQNKAILEYPDETKIYYDFTTQSQYTVPSNWHDFSFSEQGDKIVFMNDDVNPDNQWLAISNPDSTEVKLVEQLGENGDKVTVNWSPNDQIIAFSATGEDLGTWMQEIYAIGKNDENFPSLIINGRGFESKWSTSGGNLLYSVYNIESDLNPTLWITSAQGDNVGAKNVNLKINTWAKKCTFTANDSELYCAVPESLERGSGMFPEMAASVPDTIYRINLKTGQKSIVAYPSNRAVVDELFINQDESELYYKNLKTGLLEKLKIK